MVTSHCQKEGGQTQVITNKKVTATLTGARNQLVIRHVVLSAQLQNGSHYIIDPTGRQFFFEGPRRSLIVHGTEEQYTHYFPGKVISIQVSGLIMLINNW